MRDHSLALGLMQFIKYGSVGVVSNALGYSVYLVLTYVASLSPKFAMTIVYLVAASVSYFGNKNLTFAFQGRTRDTFIKYCIIMFIGYLISVSLLVGLVDGLDYPHHLVQGVAIVIVAVFLFVCLKFFVFRVLKNEG